MIPIRPAYFSLSSVSFVTDLGHCNFLAFYKNILLFIIVNKYNAPFRLFTQCLSSRSGTKRFEVKWGSSVVLRFCQGGVGSRDARYLENGRHRVIVADHDITTPWCKSCLHWYLWRTFLWKRFTLLDYGFLGGLFLSLLCVDYPNLLC